MLKRKNTLLYRFTIIFIIFGTVLTIFTSLIVYVSGSKSVKNQSLLQARQVADYMEQMIFDNPDDFLAYKHFYMKNHDLMKIPYDFTDTTDALNTFNEAFIREYPGKSLYTDIDPTSMPYDIQLLYYTYRHEYWLLTFEKACSSFDVSYTYFLVPDSSNYSVTYMIDAERIRQDENPDLLYLGNNYETPYHKYKILWNVWLSCQTSNDFQIWNNKQGHTYAYYKPLIINSEPVGLVATEININNINKRGVKNAIITAIFMFFIIGLCTILLLIYIYECYLKKLVDITNDVKIFTKKNDPSIAYKIRTHASDTTEISYLALQLSAMILDVDRVVKELFALKHNSDASTKTILSSKLVTRDALTGLPNEVEFKNNIRTISVSKYCIVMINVNNIKQYKELYGCDRVDIAIKSAADIMQSSFGQAQIFRLEEDIFAVILEGSDVNKKDYMIKLFKRKVNDIKKNNKLKRWEKISVTVGYSVNNENTPDEVAFDAKQKMLTNIN